MSRSVLCFVGCGSVCLVCAHRVCLSMRSSVRVKLVVQSRPPPGSATTNGGDAVFGSAIGAASGLANKYLMQITGAASWRSER